MGQLYRKGQNLSSAGETIILQKEYKDEPSFDGAHVHTVGEGEEYTTIQDALNDININGLNHKHIIDVKEGVYDISNTDLPFLGMKNYVKIVGRNKTKCIIKNIKSSTVYNAYYNVFDPSYYSDGIEFAMLSNLTLINQGGKGCVHIDTDYSVFKKGGKIILDNLICIDLTTPSQEGCPASLRTDDFGGGGINIGLRRGQTVVVRNCWANGSIYAHNGAYSDRDSSGGCTFIVENCTFGHSNIGDIGSGSPDTFIFRNNKANRITINSNSIGTGAAIERYNINAILENNKVDYINGTDNAISNNAYGCFDRFFDGKFPFIENNIHTNVVNNSGQYIVRNSLVGLSNYNNYGENNIMGIGIKPFSEGDIFAGYTMESFDNGTEGIIQYNGVLRWADEKDFTIGTYLKPKSSSEVQSCDISEAVFVIIGKHEIEDSPGWNVYFLRIIKPIL